MSDQEGSLDNSNSQSQEEQIILEKQAKNRVIEKYEKFLEAIPNEEEREKAWKEFIEAREQTIEMMQLKNFDTELAKYILFYYGIQCFMILVALMVVIGIAVWIFSKLFWIQVWHLIIPSRKNPQSWYYSPFLTMK